jgi:hypothetical protein
MNQARQYERILSYGYEAKGMPRVALTHLTR